MKKRHVIIYILSIIIISSCIRDEALNAEADILNCRLPGVNMTTSPIINNNSVSIFVEPGTYNRQNGLYLNLKTDCTIFAEKQAQNKSILYIAQTNKKGFQTLF